MNPQNSNQNKPTKNKFIHEALFDEASASSSASSSGQVISWGVGRQNNNVSNDVNFLDSTQVINMIGNDFVDSQSVSVEQIVDGARVSSGVDQNSLSPEFAQSNGVFYGYNANPELLQNNQMQNQMNVNVAQNNDLNNQYIQQQSVVPVQNDMMTNNVVVDDNIASNQPLAMMALSGEAIDESQKPKDVDENAKYFQKTPLVDNTLHAPEVVVAAGPVVDPLAEPQRNLDTGELIRSFVGIQYQDITMSSFNFWSGFFGPMYYFYRKMYLYGFIITVLNLLLMLLMLVNPLIYLGGSVVEFLLICLITNSLYLGFSKNQVIKIVAMNPNANQHELKQICQKKGGTSLLVAILICVCTSTLSSAIMFGLGITDILMDYADSFDKKVLPKDDTPIEEVVDYTLPSGFVEYKEDPAFKTYYETDTLDGKEVKRESCMFSIGLVANHKTSKDLVIYMADADKRYNRVSTYKASNGDVWDVYDYVSNGSHYIYRARKIDGHIVLITYASVKGSTEGLCDNFLEEIMNSVKEK